MTSFVSGADRTQGTMFPAQLEAYVAEENPVRVIDFFVDQLDLGQLGFGRVHAKLTGRPAYHAAVMLKLYIYGYLNRVQSSRRLERECQRNVEVMWLTGCLAPDFKTIADFRKDNGPAIRVANSSWSAGAPACLRPQRSPSTEASSRRSTRATGISRKPRRPSGWSRSRRASSVICPSLKPPTASPLRPKSSAPGSRAKSTG